MLDLDFNLSTSKERQHFINEYVKNRTFTQKELETMANYILYGKDEDGTNVVNRKEIEINTKYGSYKKKAPESLDSLIENPNFNENKITHNSIYRKEKPKIDRELDKDVPGMQELWKTIDYFQHLIDCNTGKIEDPGARKLTSLELYKIKHTLIEMRREQFALRDMVKPTYFYGSPIQDIEIPIGEDIPWDSNDNYSIKPLGLYSSNPQRFTNILDIKEKDYQYNKEAKYILDFTNPEHIYNLIECYDDLLIAAEDAPERLTDDIIETLDFYINMAELDNIKSEILRLKIKKIPVLGIQKVLKDKYNVNHSTNYISTIYKQKICNEIAAAAQLHYDMYINRDNRSMWKKCNQCGELKFLDSRIFMRKAKSSDGYNSKCKKCCKENRKKNKK